MPDPILDPNLPADNSLISAAELRGQFQAIQNQFAGYTQVLPLGIAISNPPTQQEMQWVVDKLDEVIEALHGGPPA